MKKWMNTLFFGSFFIAAMLIEIYSIQILEGNLFSTAGLGIVVLIAGYLFMDSIRGALRQGREEAKFYMDRVFSEEAEKWNERYTELLNLQKASYTATKKNSAASAKQSEEILSKLEAILETRLKTLEENHAKAWQRITELQKKALEGQKNALNLELQYSKENTKRIIGILQEEEKNTEIGERLSEILSLLEINNRLLQSWISRTDNKGTGDYPDSGAKPKEARTGEAFEEDNIAAQDFYQQLDTAGHTIEPGWSLEKEEPEPEAAGQPDVPDEKPKAAPLYEDPNKALTADEIAALFASFGK
jgi:hypothetical protein